VRKIHISSFRDLGHLARDTWLTGTMSLQQPQEGIMEFHYSEEETEDGRQ